MTLTLTSEIEKALADAASRQGTTPESLALECLRERFVPSQTGEGQSGSQSTLADFLAEHIGVLASSRQVPGGAQLSQETGKRFTAGLVERRKQGRL